MELRFYGAVTPLTKDSHVPLAIPENLQRKLLCSYACAELFEDIEDGIEGPKVNTDKHRGKYNTTLAELEITTKQGQSRRAPARDNNKWA